MGADQLTVYTKSWCADCHVARRVLKRHSITYLEVDIEHDDEARDKVLAINRGMASVPTIVFPSGRVLVEPAAAALSAALVEEGFLSASAP